MLTSVQAVICQWGWWMQEPASVGLTSSVCLLHHRHGCCRSWLVSGTLPIAASYYPSSGSFSIFRNEVVQILAGSRWRSCMYTTVHVCTGVHMCVYVDTGGCPMSPAIALHSVSFSDSPPFVFVFESGSHPSS